MLGDELRKARLTAQLTQEQLAAKAGVTREHISSLENNHRSPTIDTLLALAKALGVKASNLIRRVER